MRKTVISALLMLSMLTAPAFSHLWYPDECCGGQDCAVVEKFEPVYVPADIAKLDRAPNLFGKIGGFKVTTRHGTAIVPDDLVRRRSKDANWHACMRQNPLGSGMRLICLFEPDTI